MASLNTKSKTTTKGGAKIIKPKLNKVTTTYEGQPGLVLKAKSELFITAISTFLGEETFYESANDRVKRIVDLTHKVTKKDPEWVENFVAWLRGPEANIRTASLVIAAEYVAAGGPNGRTVINSVCQRADEPAEILAYWINHHNPKRASGANRKSPKLPQAIRKGLGDAVQRLYNEKSVLKYFGTGKAVNMASVLNLVHPTPLTPQQSDLFKYIIDRSYSNELELSNLPILSQNRKVKSEGITVEDLTPEFVKDSGLTWEQLGSLLKGGWTAKAWEAMIPNLGYMALLRNLRNMEQAGISSEAIDLVNKRLSDPVEVARSRQLPFRFYSAMKNTNSYQFSGAIERGLDLSLQNIPVFDEDTLVLVDASGSMTWGAVSGNSSINPANVAALFGAAIAQVNPTAKVVAFGDRAQEVTFQKGSSTLKRMEVIQNANVGHSTNFHDAFNKYYVGQKRVIVLSDMQFAVSGGLANKAEFIHFFNLNGYQQAPSELRDDGRYYYGGFSDTMFKAIPLIEKGQNQEWPF